MARIAGVNIPTNKRVVIALQYIHGIGQKNAKTIVEKAIEVNSDLVKFQIYSKNEFIHRKSSYYNEFKRDRL